MAYVYLKKTDFQINSPFLTQESMKEHNKSIYFGRQIKQ